MIITMPHVHRESFEQAAWPHRPSLYRLALQLARRPDVAEDLVQDTYVRAFRGFHTFEPGTNLRAWLFQILRHAFINRYRSEKSRGTEVDFDATERAAGFDRSCGADPESLAMGSILPDAVREALEEIPPAFRDAIELAFIEELSYQEIAERLGVPIGTVMSRIHRGRKLLKERLRDFAASRRLIAAGSDDRRCVA